MNNPYIYPYNSLLNWDDPTSVTLSGTADSGTLSVSAIDNGVVSKAYFNSSSNEWSYDTSISGYSNSFLIISENSIGESASSSAFIDVDSPIIINTELSYNRLNPTLEGRTSVVTKYLEASPDSISYSPSGFIHDSYNTDFLYNNFIFRSPVQSFYFIGTDSFGNSSTVRELTLNYKMLDPTIDTIVSDPYDSRTVFLSGKADLDVASFVYSPTGGQFSTTRVDTASSSYSEWSYKFVLMSPTEEFKIKTVDVFGNESIEQTRQIKYGVEKPIILLPGTIKKISDDTAISGSTSTEFLTLSGEFRDNGIIAGDVVLAVNGKNIGEYKSVTKVNDKSLVTDSFPHQWDVGDKIKIYPNSDRPTIYTSGKSVELSGKCNKNIAKVRYYTEDVKPVKAYAKNIQDYTITTLTNNLVLNINGKFEFVLLPEGVLTAQDIASVINAKFRNTFDYDVAFANEGRLYLQAIHIHIYPGSANSVIGFVEGEVNFILEVAVPDSITFKNSAVGGNDCSTVVASGLLHCMNIDGVFIRIPLQTNTLYTKDELISKINAVAGKEVATNIGPNIVYSAAENLWVGDDFPELNLKEQLNGNANFNNGLSLSADISADPDSIKSGGYPNSAGEGDWNINLQIVQPSNDIKVYGLNEFYVLSEPVSLNVEFKAPAPTINPYPPEVTMSFVDLSGTYTDTSLSVLVNGLPADFYNAGQWVTQVPNLNMGDNTIVVSSIDRFGRPTESTEVYISRVDQFDNSFPIQDDSVPLKWKWVNNPSFSPEQVKKVADTIDSIFKPIIEVLDFVSSLLDTAKALINEYIIGPVQALRRALQALIDNITELLNSLVNGMGLYTLSTLPEWSDMKRNLPMGFLDPIKGSFPDFFNKIQTSFDDSFDAYRPQLSPTSVVGGAILAVGDFAGLTDFMNALKSLEELINKQKFDYGLDPVNNFKAEGQNKRVVLTWTAPDGGSNIFPYDYVIYRSKVSGGGLPITNYKSSIDYNVESPLYYPEEEYNPTTGKIEGEYELIGRLTNYRVMKEFKFIDGCATLQESNNQKGIDKFVKGSVDFFSACREYVMVSMGSTEKPLYNGVTHYYKVVIEVNGTKVQGTSPEVICAPSLPDLELVTEYFNDQITQNGAGLYVLSGSIYNGETGLFADNIIDFQVRVDGKTVMPEMFYSEKGYFGLKKEPKQSLEVRYFRKKEKSTTRASLVGLKEGPYFVFKKESNTLGIQVGRGANITEQFGGKPITRTQTVTFNSFFKSDAYLKLWKEYYDTHETDVNVKKLTAEDVASIIRSQTSGLKVFVDRRNRIVLEEDQNPDIYRGSYLKITESNKVLGFSTDADKASMDIEGDDNTHTVSEAGPSHGVPPDWKSIRISDLFPEINDLIRYIKNTFDQLANGLTSATDSLIDFINLLQTKVDALANMIKEVQELLKRLIKILTLQGGIYVLIIPPKAGGSEYFNEAIRTSVGYPTDGEYTGGVVFLYTDGGTGKALDWILSSLK